MREVSNSDLWQVTYVLLGGISILFGVATGDLFFFFFTLIYIVMYSLHAWIGMKGLDLDFLSRRVKTDLEFKKQDIEDKKFGAILNELKEIRKALQKKR